MKKRSIENRKRLRLREFVKKKRQKREDLRVKKRPKG